VGSDSVIAGRMNEIQSTLQYRRHLTQAKRLQLEIRARFLSTSKESRTYSATRNVRQNN
jgi:hypothetical protein